MEEARNSSSGEFRVLMFPWLAHGHVSPFVQLANKLISRQPNSRVYICSSPVILASISDAKLIKHPSRIHLVELHLPANLPDLPPHHHTTKGLPAHLFTTLLTAVDMASSDFSQILTKLSPDMLISDVLQHWAPELALSLLKIPTVILMTSGAFSTAVGGTSADTSSSDFDFIKIGSPSLGERYSWSVERSSEVMLINSSGEIEAEYIRKMSESSGKSVVPVGPLIPDHDDDNDDDENEMVIINWLDKKDPSSVVYISFGSEGYLSRAEIEELAHALLILIEGKSQLSFLWVVRFPIGEEVEIGEALPEGFAAAAGERVHVVAGGWAPQRKVLRHESVGGFVSHCGWNSVLESIKCGVPIVAAPLRSEQPLNAMLVELLGVGKKVGRIERGHVAEVIEEVMVARKGMFRGKAKEMRDALVKRGDDEVDQAIRRLLRLCTTFSV